ncbi:ABC transporter permease [Georgfuchsia toluolica]|uniref:ABC transporter permease n=1 Tax=Georgfuchsia toluolica TaxID=424218 RepID=UPI001FEC3779|nr:ABC transporter permease [Georgfuchsia toluolica]
MNRNARLTAWLIGGPPWLYLLLLFAMPTLIMVAASFAWPGPEGGLSPLWIRDAGGIRFDLTWDNYTDLVTPIYGFLILKSFGYAVAVTLLCLVLAYPLALTIARSPKRWRNTLFLLVIVPFWSNFLVRIYAWMIILGPQAALTRLVNDALGLLHLEPVALLFSPFAVIVGLVYVHLPFMILPLYANLEKHDPALLDAASDLGANAWECFRRVTFPLSLPGVIAGAILVFIPALGAFAVPDILGGTRGIMIGNVIKMQFLEARDWPFGSSLSIVVTLIVLLFVAVAALAARRGGGRLYA